MKREIFFVLTITLMVVFAGVMNTGCKKEFVFTDNVEQVTPVADVVGLSASTTAGSGMKIASNQVIQTDSVYYNAFWLTPPTGTVIPMGIWIIRDATNVVIYQSAMPENGIDIKFPFNGTFTLEVSGNYQGSPFLFNNVTIVVGSVSPPPPPPTTATSPVRLYNFSVSGGTATVNVAISKAQWQTQSGATWFHVKRVNNLNFIGNQTVVSTTDSVFFTLNFSAVNQTYVEFNGAFHDGSPGGVWLIPGYGTPPSILYTGSVGVPYGGSENFFGFRLHSVGSGIYELRTHSGTLVLTTATPTTPTIPGNAGDGPLNGYQVRWSGYHHWFKTNEPNPTIRWRMGPTGAWNFIVPNPTAWPTNTSYVTWEFPQLTGQVQWQNGTGSGTNFVPDNANAILSIFAGIVGPDTVLVKYMK